MSTLQKQIILGFFVVLFGAIFWYFLHYIFYIGNLTTEYWIGGAIIIILWGISLCLAMLLIEDKRILYGSFILTLILFGLFFNNEPFYYLIALLILFLFFWIASKKMKKEEEVQVNLNFWRIWKRGLPMLVTALILVVSLVYYFSPELMNKRDTRINIPKNVFNAILKPIEGLIGEKLPQGIGLNSDAEKILQPEQRVEIERQFGIKINSGDTGRDILYKLVDFQLNNITGPYRYLIPLGLAIGLFIALKIISILYVAIVIMLSWLTLKLLIALKFIKVEIETKEVETVKL